MRLRAGDATIELAALAGDLFRVGLFPRGKPPRYVSDAVAKDAAHAGAESTGSELRTAEATAHVELDPTAADLLLGRLRAPLRRRRPRSGDRRIDARRRHRGPDRPPLRLTKAREPGERFFGCGERTGGLEKTGSHQVFWNIDPPAGHTAALNNLYTSIPFVLALHDGRAHGLFVDNPGRVEIDLARGDPAAARHRGAARSSTTCSAGPTPREVLERYTELTGRIPLPPLWALG